MNVMISHKAKFSLLRLFRRTASRYSIARIFEFYKKTTDRKEVPSNILLGAQ